MSPTIVAPLTTALKTPSQGYVIRGIGFWSVTQIAKGDQVTLSADGYDAREIDVN